MGVFGVNEVPEAPLRMCLTRQSSNCSQPCPADHTLTLVSREIGPSMWALFFGIGQIHHLFLLTSACHRARPQLLVYLEVDHQEKVWVFLQRFIVVVGVVKYA